jgi:hypothetical protein
MAVPGAAVVLVSCTASYSTLDGDSPDVASLGDPQAGYWEDSLGYPGLWVNLWHPALYVCPCVGSTTDVAILCPLFLFSGMGEEVEGQGHCCHSLGSYVP